ncbi:RNA 2',3'-cyclic phosphodiesterase [Candidatus Entotheonellaceae bacterium PAL068K]
MMIRAFVAITPPSRLQRAVQTLQGAALNQTLPWRWVAPANVHLTLAFLGDVASEQIEPIAQAIDRAVIGLTAFPLRFRSLGCFPNRSRPRVLWMGLEDPEKALEPLHARLETVLVALDFSPEARPFRPHLTLARLRHRVDRHTLDAFLQAHGHQQFGETQVTHVDLLQSQLHPDGALYTLLRSVPLQQSSTARPLRTDWDPQQES